jgi:hypothetical protein
MPTSDVRGGQWSVSLTAANIALVVPIPGLSVDYGITDSVSIGAVNNLWGTGARAAWRVYEAGNGFSIAAVASGGSNHNFVTMMGAGPFVGFPVNLGQQPPAAGLYGPFNSIAGAWGQPAVAATLPIGGPDSPFVLRGMVGPVIGFAPPPQGGEGAGQLGPLRFSTMLIVPNLELAYRPTRGLEVTLGGYDMLGVRWRF